MATVLLNLSVRGPAAANTTPPQKASWDWAHPAHVCAGTGLTPPHLHRDWAHPATLAPGLSEPLPHLLRDLQVSNGGSVSGACAFEWSDEFWKSSTAGALSC